MLKVVCETAIQANLVIEQLQKLVHRNMKRSVVAQGIECEIKRILGLCERVVNQTERRVLRGESVPAGEKIVSILESHTDIIIKDRRDTFYGHKIYLTTGSSGLVLDLVVERGNPADSTLAQKVIDRVRTTLGRVPKQVSFDGGFSSFGRWRTIR